MKTFINYRHEDTQATAWALYRALKDRFGADNVFFDNGTLRPGDRWLREIESNLASADVFLALIGDKWMTSLNKHRVGGGRDFVATEIDLAFRASSRVTVIPVLVDNANPPDPDQLPLSLKQLPACQVQRLDPTQLLDDIDALVGRLEALRDQPPPQRSPEATPKSVRDNGHSELETIDETGEPESDYRTAAGPDEDHYQAVVEGVGNIVFFLGAGVNADDHLPDDSDLSNYLAKQSKLAPQSSQLAEVAQRVRTLRGEPRMFKWISSVLTPPIESPPAPVQRYLACLPRRLEQLGYERRYSMIVTTKYDVALERAFIEEHEPFDVAVYMGPGTPEGQRGKFVHIPWGEQPRAIDEPNTYNEFPITVDGELLRTVIVRIHGAVRDPDAGFQWKDNFVITEDHYIDYLSGRTTEALIPTQILAKLSDSDCLFLGYRIADWRLRVFLKRIWKGEKLGRALYWAVEPNPDALECKLWQDAGVQLLPSRLSDWAEGLDTYLREHRHELSV